MALTRDAPGEGAERRIIQILLDDLGVNSEEILRRLSADHKEALGYTYEAQQDRVQMVRTYTRMVVDEMRRLGLLPRGP